MSPEITLTVGNIKTCLDDAVPIHEMETLSQELGVPARHIGNDAHCERTRVDAFCGVKVWVLLESTASWQKFAIALYSSKLDEALKKLKQLQLLPLQGLFGSA